jgi:hypothetical protein
MIETWNWYNVETWLKHDFWLERSKTSRILKTDKCTSKHIPHELIQAAFQLNIQN